MKTTSEDPALLVGLDAPDDAAVYRITDDVAIVQTVDFFTPIVDDPFDWGRIATANSLSDVYAMGASPMTALNLLAWPRGLDMALLGRVLEGAGAVCDEAEVTVLGGHSIDDPEPKFGLAVTGTVDPDKVVRTTGAEPGCDLVLTKPLGMGVISSGIKEGRTSLAAAQEAVAVMASLNRAASNVMVDVGVAAATDVTGFGLIGHLAGMVSSDLSVTLKMASIPVVAEAFELAAAGTVPSGTRSNRATFAARTRLDPLSEEEQIVLFDAQTSGGLLIAVSADRTDDLVVRLHDAGVTEAAHIGMFEEGDGTITVE